MVVGIPVQALRTELDAAAFSARDAFRKRIAEIDARVTEELVDITLAPRGDQGFRLIGTEVSRVSHLPEGMTTMATPASRFLHHRHEGPAQDVAVTLATMAAWAAANGHRAGSLTLAISDAHDVTDRVHELFLSLA